MAAQPQARNAHTRRRTARGVLAGLAIFVAVAAGVGAVVFHRPKTWSATASAIVFPAPGIDPAAAAGYYDTLSRGQIVATYAQILRLQQFERAAGAALALAPATMIKSKVTVQVVPDTALLAITATAPGPAAAEQLADGTLKQATSYIQALNSPYTVTSVAPAAGTATRTTWPKATTLAAGLLVALVAGLAVQQVVHQLLGSQPTDGAVDGRAAARRTVSAGPTPEVAAESSADELGDGRPPVRSPARSPVGQRRAPTRAVTDAATDGSTHAAGDGGSSAEGEPRRSGADPGRSGSARAGSGRSGSGRSGGPGSPPPVAPRAQLEDLFSDG